MSLRESYQAACHIQLGEVDGFGYAFVPGSPHGVVLLDVETKRLLEAFISGQDSLGQERIERLEAVGLVVQQGNKLALPRLERDKIRSVSIWLHVTNSCNLNCPYCYIADKGRGQNMPVSVMQSFLDKLEATVEKHGLKRIAIRLAGGEPTLNSRVVRLLVEEVQSRFVSRGIDVAFALLTNGTLITEDWVSFLSRYKVGLSISLDGTREWHNSLRFFGNGKGSFDQIMHSLDLCKRFKLKPSILSTITEANIENLQTFGRFLIDSGLSFRLGVYRDNAGGYSGYRAFIAKLMVELDTFYTYYAEAIRSGRAMFRHQLSDLHLDRRIHLRTCNVGHSGVAVGHAGEVFLCQAGMNRDRIGHLSEGRTFLEMTWQQRLAPELSSATVFDYPGCRGCQWAQVCGGGCPLVNSSANGSATTSSPYCDLFKAMIPRLIELKALDQVRRLRVLQSATPNMS